MMVLWNTIYMQAGLDQLRAERVPVLAEDVAHLSLTLMTTSTCSAATRSRSRYRSPVASYDRSETPRMAMLNRFSAPLLPKARAAARSWRSRSCMPIFGR